MSLIAWELVVKAHFELSPLAVDSWELAVNARSEVSPPPRALVVKTSEKKSSYKSEIAGQVFMSGSQLTGMVSADNSQAEGYKFESDAHYYCFVHMSSF